jgi:hypothetical protein
VESALEQLRHVKEERWVRKYGITTLLLLQRKRLLVWKCAAGKKKKKKKLKD